MKNASRFHPEFSRDLAAATRYYDNISVDLGDRFRDGVKHALKAISDRPESFGFVSPRLRATMIRHFPYVVLYRFVDQTVYFLGIFHAASDSKRWLERGNESRPTD